MFHVEHVILSVHAVATAMLCGLIWFVQVVHYPMFRHVGNAQFIEYERIHQQRTTWIVVPLMLIELVTGVWIALAGLAPFWLAWTGVGLIGLLWLSTACVQVPLHARLSRGWDDRAGRLLVLTNWVRTGAWSARVVIAALMIPSA